MSTVDLARDEFFKSFHRLYNESEFAAERLFEQLTLMQKTAVARAASVEFKRHLRDYVVSVQRSIGHVIREMKRIDQMFGALPDYLANTKLSKMSFFAYVQQVLDESEMNCAARKFEQLTSMQKMLVARVAEVEFREHLPQYDASEQAKIITAISRIRQIAQAFVLPVSVNDFTKIDYEVVYED